MSTVFPPSCAARFRHEAELASGGYGTVHRAVQIALERPVVVKLLHATTQEPEQLARFAAEARVTASLADPHIVVVIDHDVAGGVPWIAYEELPGPEVRALLDAGVPPVSEATRIASHVASALAAAHARGVLHRDIKPENVLGAGSHTYKVTDFGIAKWAGAGVATADGVILGTPAYLSPEVCEGKAARAASDVYALGVMLHELLAGRRPFERDGVMDLLTAHVRDAPPRLDGAPPALADLVARMLAKAPLERPSPDEVRAVLAPFHGEEAAVRPRSRPSGRTPAQVTRGARPVQLTKPSGIVAAPPRRWPLAAAGLAVTLIAAGALFRRSPPPPPPAPTAAVPSASPLAPITLGQVQRLAIRIPAQQQVEKWERTGAIWPRAQYAFDIQEEFRDAEKRIDKLAPDDGDARGDVLVDRTVFVKQIAFRRILQDDSEGKRSATPHIQPFRHHFESLARDKASYARSGRLHAFVATLAFAAGDNAAATKAGLRALGLAPVKDETYVRQPHVTAELLHAVGFAARQGGVMTPDAALHLLKLAHEGCPTNPSYAANYARELAVVDPPAAERVLDHAGPLNQHFWTHDARFHVAYVNGRVARARRALDAMRAAPHDARGTAHLEQDRGELVQNCPGYLERLAPLERVVELETEWEWARGQPELLASIRRLAKGEAALEAALVARDLAPLPAGRAGALSEAAHAAGAVRTETLLAAKRGHPVLPLASLDDAALRRALRIELYRTEPPDEVTRAVAALLGQRLPRECDALYERLLAGDPDADLLAQAARVARIHGRHDEALDRAERALKKSPAHLLATIEANEQLMRQKRHSEVIARTQALRDRPDLPLELVDQIAQAETEASDGVEAEAYLTPRISRDDAEGSGWVLRYRLALALIKQGKLDGAEAELLKVGQKTHDNAQTREARARIAALRQLRNRK